MVKKQEPEEEEMLQIDSASALAFAGDTLLRVVELAESLNDTEAMLSAAKGWLEISDRLNPIEEEKGRKPFGFNTFPGVEIEVTDDDGS